MDERTGKRRLVALGKRVEMLRLARGWTQATAAEHTGIDLRTFQEIETAKVNTSARSLYRLMDGFDVTADALLVRRKPNAVLKRRSTPPTMEEELEHLGKRVAFLRKERGLSRAELEAKADVSVSTVKAIELASYPTSFAVLYKIATALEVRLHVLFTIDPRTVADEAPRTATPTKRPSERTK